MLLKEKNMFAITNVCLQLLLYLAIPTTKSDTVVGKFLVMFVGEANMTGNIFPYSYLHFWVSKGKFG